MPSVAMEVDDIIARRGKRHGDLFIPSRTDNILLIDNGCDISIISNNSFLLNTYTSTYFTVDGTLPNMKTNALELVNDCFCCAQLPNNKLVI